MAPTVVASVYTHGAVRFSVTQSTKPPNSNLPPLFIRVAEAYELKNSQRGRGSSV